MATTAMPLRADFPLTIDPFKYRLLEVVGVYGDALRGLITIDVKFLRYKVFVVALEGAVRIRTGEHGEGALRARPSPRQKGRL